MDNDVLLTKRFSELSHRSYEGNYFTYTNFLNADEISTLLKTDTDTKKYLFGGCKNAERCVCGFGNHEPISYPIDCIAISPVNQKFSDKLTHRDFLGALMNLGIEREMLGDIKIIDNTGYLFCLSKISQYIIDSLDRIKHTTVKCKIVDNVPNDLNALPDGVNHIVSSLRIDTVTSSVMKLSRSAVSQLINQQKVYINSRLIYKDSVQLKENDIVSVRGHGRYIFYSIENETKKYKIVVSIGEYK